jgi:hypothetical protein
MTHPNRGGGGVGVKAHRRVSQGARARTRAHARRTSSKIIEINRLYAAQIADLDAPSPTTSFGPDVTVQAIALTGSLTAAPQAC